MLDLDSRLVRMAKSLPPRAGRRSGVGRRHWSVAVQGDAHDWPREAAGVGLGRRCGVQSRRHPARQRRARSHRARLAVGERTGTDAAAACGGRDGGRIQSGWRITRYSVSGWLCAFVGAVVRHRAASCCASWGFGGCRIQPRRTVCSLGRHDRCIGHVESAPRRRAGAHGARGRG